MAGIDVNVLKSYLQFGLVYVEFTKKDGTLRKMWCTRDNGIVIRTGHDLVQFTHSDAKARERNGMLFVYDIQEHDVRMLNSRTVDAATLVHYEDLDDVEIPSIKTRFEIDAERSLNVDAGLSETALGGKDVFDMRSDATRETVRKAGLGATTALGRDEKKDVGLLADTALEDALSVSGTGSIDLAGAESVAGRTEDVTLADGMLTELTTGAELTIGAEDVLGTDDFLFGGSDDMAREIDLFGLTDVGSSVSSVTDESITEVVPVTERAKEKIVVTEIEVKRSKAEDALAIDLGDGSEDDWLL